MADAYCGRCGAKLGFQYKWRGGTLCESCRTDDKTGSQGQTTRVMASGLVSVADLAAFKRSLGSLPGVRNVTVQSAANGRFEFLVRHDPGTALGWQIQALPDWRVRHSEDVADTGDGVPGTVLAVVCEGRPQGVR